MGSVWRWLVRNKELVFSGAGVAILAAAMGLFWPGDPEPAPAVTATDGGIAVGRDLGATAEPGGTAAIQTGAGTINVNNFSASTIDEIKKAGVTEAALSSFFKILERQQVPPEDLDNTLREIAKRYRELEERLRRFTSDDPKVVALKQAAREALEGGDFARTERLLEEAKQRDIAAAKAMQESTRKRLLSAAESAAEQGDVKNTELAYAEAAAYYAEAAELVGEKEAALVEQRGRYLQRAGRAFWLAGAYAQAADVLEQALQSLESVLGAEHVDLGICLDCLGAALTDAADYERAEGILKRSVRIHEQAIGPEHPDVAMSLNNLAELYRARAATPRPSRSCSGRSRSVSRPSVPSIPMSRRASTTWRRSMTRRAATPRPSRSTARALAIREKALGADASGCRHQPQQPGGALPRAGPLRRGRAALPAGAGDPGEGPRPRASRCRDQPQQPGGALPRAGPLRRGRAALPAGAGDPREGPRPRASRCGHEPQQPGGAAMTRRAATARPSRSTSGRWRSGRRPSAPTHPDVAASLNNLAGLYDAQGRYAEAEPLYERALAIWEKALGPEHPDVATSLNNLAELYRDQGRYAEAEPLYERALAIREKALGPDASGCRGEPQQPGGALPQAGPLRRGRAALPRGRWRSGRRPSAPTHPDVATSLNNLAGLYHAQGRYAEAEPLLKRALAIVEETLGPQHPNTVTMRENYETLLAAMREQGEAAASTSGE